MTKSLVGLREAARRMFPYIKWSHVDGKRMVSKSRVIKSKYGYFVGRSCLGLEGAKIAHEVYARESSFFAKRKDATRFVHYLCAN